MIKKLTRLIAGLFLYAVGDVMTINAGLGLSPWDILHQGAGYHVGITIGQACIAIGLIIVIFNFILKEKVGVGTVLNMILIGVFMDILMINHLIPQFDALPLQILMLIGGIFVVGLATYVYIGAGLGSGPRDGFMVAICRKSGKSVRTVRIAIEVTAAFLGFLLGGHLGVGTVIMAVGFGIATQFSFKLFHFDVQGMKHQYIDEEIRRWFTRKPSGNAALETGKKGENNMDKDDKTVEIQDQV